MSSVWVYSGIVANSTDGVMFSCYSFRTTIFHLALSMCVAVLSTPIPVFVAHNVSKTKLIFGYISSVEFATILLHNNMIIDDVRKLAI